jgi:hypothetical protein
MTIFNPYTTLAKKMRLRLGKFFVDLGHRHEEHNVIDIRNVEGKNRSIGIGLLAEQFDAALTFYIRVAEFMMLGAISVAVELRGWNMEKIQEELESLGLKAVQEASSTRKIVFIQVPSQSIGRLLNVVWLASGIRIIGFREQIISYATIFTELEKEALPSVVDFVIEKKSNGTADFLYIRCEDRCASAIAFIEESSFNLKHPLVTARIPL